MTSHVAPVVGLLPPRVWAHGDDSIRIEFVVGGEVVHLDVLNIDRPFDGGHLEQLLGILTEGRVLVDEAFVRFEVDDVYLHGHRVASRPGEQRCFVVSRYIPYQSEVCHFCEVS